MSKYPYCDHPECHTVAYRAYGLEAATHSNLGVYMFSNVLIKMIGLNETPPGMDRLCHAHAMQKWRVA